MKPQNLGVYSRFVQLTALATLCAFFAAACAGGRPRIRLHGWPDDIDLAEILESIVDEPKTARSHAPELVWSKNGKETRIDDPSAALAPFRPAIKDALVPPRDATPRDLRCDVDHLRCIDDSDTARTVFTFTWKGPPEKRYPVLSRMETTPRPR